MSNIDYVLKSNVMKLGLDKIENKISLSYFRTYQEIVNQDGIYLKKPYEYDFAKALEEEIIEQYGYTYYNEAKKINNASFKRNTRLKDKIESMLQIGQCIFLTLTFKDKILNNTSGLTRKRYVVRYLKNVSSNYIANIDYGAKNDREHYHAIVLANNIDYSLWHKIGAINGEIIHIQDFDTSIKIAKYINKLTNHAIKETTKRNAIIYSR